LCNVVLIFLFPLSQEEAKKLADDIEDAKKKLQDYKDGIDGNVDKGKELAQEMRKEIPPAVKYDTFFPLLILGPE